MMRTAYPILTLLLAGAPLLAGLPAGDYEPPAAPHLSAAAPALPPAARPRAEDLPAFLRRPGVKVSLAQAVDLALRGSPDTRDAWHAARAAAAARREKNAAYYPIVDASVGYVKSRQTVNGGKLVVEQTTWGPSLNLYYLLFDLGGRGAAADETRAALAAADWRQREAIQNVILDVQRAYAAYQGAKARAAAARDARDSAKAAWDAAEARRKAGVATIAEALQARADYEQSLVVVADAEGRVISVRGALLTTLGAPATLDVDVEDLPASVPDERDPGPLQGYLDSALAARPDLVAARWDAARDEAKAREAAAAGRPRLELSGAAGRTEFLDPTGIAPARNYSAGVTLRIPLFAGGQRHFARIKAEEEAARSREKSRGLENDAVYKVFNSYYGLLTAGARVRAAAALLETAKRSREAAFARYKAGAGSLLELLDAQRRLADAQALDAQARADWLLAAAQLAHDSGTLAPPDSPPPGETVQESAHD